MKDEHLMGNLKSVVLCLENNKPAAVKGKKWIRSLVLKTSMGKPFAIKEESVTPKHIRFMI
jgi:ribosomal protein L1